MEINKKIACIGAGHMAEALVRGLLDSGVAPAARLMVTDPLELRREYFRAAFGVAGSSSNPDAVRGSDILILAVKPQVMRETLIDIASLVTPQHVLISIAAGVPTSVLESCLPAGSRVVRVMPNIVAAAGMGASALCGGSCASEDDVLIASRIIGASGVVVRVREDQMDAVTAVSGSGPAYVFYFMEAMEKAADTLGLPKDVARTLIQATVEGAGRMVRTTGLEPAELRAKVTSKGGTTAAALAVMENRNMPALILEAMQAAHTRARELAGG